MKIYFRVFGWLLYAVSFIIYITLWFRAYQYISDKIGPFFAIVLVFVTNVVGPLLYVIWHWIADSFPSQYFFLWIVAIVAYWIAGLIIGLASDK